MRPQQGKAQIAIHDEAIPHWLVHWHWAVLDLWHSLYLQLLQRLLVLELVQALELRLVLEQMMMIPPSWLQLVQLYSPLAWPQVKARLRARVMVQEVHA